MKSNSGAVDSKLIDFIVDVKLTIPNDLNWNKICDDED